MSDTTRPVDITVTPEPTPLEMAAILAAHDALWPADEPKTPTESPSTRWRFSGRWWLNSELRPFR